MSNLSFSDVPSQAPVQLPLAKGDRIPPILAPVQGMETLGCERGETEPAELANSPIDPFVEFFAHAKVDAHANVEFGSSAWFF